MPPEALFYPAYLQYTGNDTTSLSPSRVIELEYEGLNSIPAKFIGGERIYPGGRLAHINTYEGASVNRISSADVDIQGKLVRQYNFTYLASQASGFNLLETVEECGYPDGVVSPPTCLAKTTFDWNNSPTAYKSATASGQAYDDERYIFVGDFNGDGMQDLLYTLRTGAALGQFGIKALQWHVLPGGGKASATGFAESPISTDIDALNPNNAVIMDYDGDGKDDIVVSNCDEDSIYKDAVLDYYPGPYVCGGRTYTTSAASVFDWVVLRSTGSGFEVIDTGLKAPVFGRYFDYDSDHKIFGIPKLHSGDFDGDGLIDLAYGIPQDANTIWGDGSQYGTSLDTTSTSTLKFIKHTNNDTGSQFIDVSPNPGFSDSFGIRRIMDFNGDGRPDIVGVGPGSGVCRLWYSISKANEDTFSFSSPVDIPARVCGDAERTRVLDVNGDGLPDFITLTETQQLADPNNPDAGYMTTTKADVYINNGLDFKMVYTKNYQDTGIRALSIYYNFRFAIVMDVNTDGRQDVLIPNVGDKGTHIIDPDGGSNWFAMSYYEAGFPDPDNTSVRHIELTNTGAANGNIKKPKFIMDVNGDGRADIVNATGSEFKAVLNDPATDQPSDMIRSVTTGLGAKYDVTYSPLTDPWDRSSSNPLAQTGTYEKLDEESNSEIRDFIAPMYVVSKVESDVGGTDDGTLYRYSGGKVNTHGRGFLGFKETEAIHYYTVGTAKHQKQRVVTVYDQGLPRDNLLIDQSFSLTGRVAKTQIFGPGSSAHPGGVLASETNNEWSVTSFAVSNNAVANKTYFPYLDKTTSEKLWEPPGGGGLAVRESYVITDYKDISGGSGVPYDRFGNVERIEETITGNDQAVSSGDFTNQYSTSTVNHYDNQTGADKWYLGRLTSSTVTKSGPYLSEGAQTRTSTFTYNMATDGLLHCETAQPGDLL
ncbi:MAG: FG-GAP-like repeat-containing protein [Gammaproteobacteria bacterium]